MTDYFALLGEPRLPWLDPDSLKQKFLALSAQVHPDRVHQSPEPERAAASQRFAELNAAYNCLREPADRLRHLLELELGVKPAGIHQVPADMLDSQFEIARLCKSADTFLAEHTAITSPILKVQSFERAQEWIEKLNTVRKKNDLRRDELLRELATMNAACEKNPAPLLPRLEEIYRHLSYLARGAAQIQERIVQLSF